MLTQQSLYQQSLHHNDSLLGARFHTYAIMPGFFFITSVVRHTLTTGQSKKFPLGRNQDLETSDMQLALGDSTERERGDESEKS